MSEDIAKLFDEKKPLKQTFEMKGVKFGMIPNLEDISFGEYIDLDNYISDWQNMHKAMAVLFRPITEKVKDQYNIEPYESADKYSEILKFMPIEITLGALVFFYDLGNVLVLALTNSLAEEVEKEIIQHKGNSPKNGDGIAAFMQQHKEIYSNLKKSLDNPLLKF